MGWVDCNTIYHIINNEISPKKKKKTIRCLSKTLNSDKKKSNEQLDVCIFWKYVWVKKCVKIRIMLFKH